MSANRSNNKVSMLVALVVVSLIASACATTKVSTTPVVATPTRAASRSTATSAGLATPAGIALGPATATPAAKPTEKPTARPTEKPAATQPPVSTAKPAAVATAMTTTITAAGGAAVGAAQTTGDLSILPSKSEMKPAFGALTPKKGDQFLVITVSIENQSKTKDYAFDPANLVVLDAKGTSIAPARTDLEAKTLHPGEKIEGLVAYEVPLSTGQYTLQYASASNPTLTWMIH